MGIEKFVVDDGIEVDNVRIAISGSGEIDTLSGNLTFDSSGGTVIIDDNLTVSGTASVASNLTVSGTASVATLEVIGNATISGDLTVSGSVTTVNTETITLADNIIVLNSNENSTPTQNAGIEIERGSSANVSLRWNETTDKWELTTDGTNYADIATEAYAASLTPNSLDEIGDVNIVSASAGDFLKWNGSAWVNDPIDLGTDTVGNYVADIVSGAGITVTHTPGEGSSASVDLNANLDDLGDVDVGGAQINDLLAKGESGWVDVTPSSIAANINLNDLGDVAVAPVNVGEVLIWGDGSWISEAATAFATRFNLDDIGNVNAASPTTGHFLKWDGSEWVPAAAGGAVTTTTISTNSETTIAAFDVNSAKAAEFHVKVGQGSGLYSSKVIVLHNGATSDFTKYGELSFSRNEPIVNTGAVTWTTRTSNLEVNSEEVNAIGYGNNLWLISKLGASQLSTLRASTDGITWTTRTTVGGTYQQIDSITYGNNLWAISGGYARVFTSTDAITWTTRTTNLSSNNNLYSIEYGNGLWVTGGTYQTLASSTDAITWVTRTSNFGNTQINSIKYRNNLWVAVGHAGQLRTSTDAITWVTRTSNFGNTRIFSVAYGNSLWVAAGYGGQLRSSTDAITWVTRTSNFGFDAIESLIFANGFFLAVGGNGKMRNSTDGITWTTVTGANFGNRTIKKVAYGNGLWVAGGHFGQLSTSEASTSPVPMSVSLATDISGSDVRLRATIPDAATTSATVKVLTTTVGES